MSQPIAGAVHWSRRCPVCRQKIEQDQPFDKWACPCGWSDYLFFSARRSTDGNGGSPEKNSSPTL